MAHTRKVVRTTKTTPTARSTELKMNAGQLNALQELNHQQTAANQTFNLAYAAHATKSAELQQLFAAYWTDITKLFGFEGLDDMNAKKMQIRTESRNGVMLYVCEPLPQAAPQPEAEKPN